MIEWQGWRVSRSQSDPPASSQTKSLSNMMFARAPCASRSTTFAYLVEIECACKEDDAKGVGCAKCFPFVHQCVHELVDEQVKIQLSALVIVPHLGADLHQPHKAS